MLMRSTLSVAYPHGILSSSFPDIRMYINFPCEKMRITLFILNRRYVLIQFHHLSIVVSHHFSDLPDSITLRIISTEGTA